MSQTLLRHDFDILVMCEGNHKLKVREVSKLNYKKAIMRLLIFHFQTIPRYDLEIRRSMVNKTWVKPVGF